jgi:hypothetical protein
MGISKRQQLEVMMTSVAVLSGGFEAGRDPGVAVEQAADDVKFADAPFFRRRWRRLPNPASVGVASA